MEANWRSSPTSTTLAPARSAWARRGASFRVATMAASSTTSTVRPSSSVRPLARSRSSRSMVRASVKPSSARPTLAVQDLADHLWADDGAALLRPHNRAAHQLPLKCQQLRRRVAVDAQPPVMGYSDGSLGQEPVGSLLNLGERFLHARSDREALGQG